MRHEVLALSVALALVLAACGGASSSEDVVADRTGDEGSPVDALPDGLPIDTHPDQRGCTTDAECVGLTEAGPCQVAVCDTATGRCVAEPVADHVLCDDGDKCTPHDACLGGECLGAGEVDCDDGDPCTTDSCRSDAGGRGCVHEPLSGMACDDGNLCTEADTCTAGECLGDDAGCGCTVDADCGRFDDADLCNGVLSCQAGKCRVDPATPIACDTTFDPPCVRTTCQPQSGLCLPIPALDGAACDDGNPCTAPDHCEGAACVAGAYRCDPCEADAECAPFDDDDRCNGKVTCLEGQCQVGADSVPSCASSGDTQCRRTVCLPGTGACQALDSPDGRACSDGNLCSLGDRCLAGQCVAGAPRPCADDNGCTLDTCDPSSGCVFAPTTSPCDDGNACTMVDACDGGACVGGTPRGCDDGNPCTLDTCVPSTGCVSVPNTDPCDDGNPCTLDDQCSSGVCLGGANECPCDVDAGCAPYDDDDACNGTLVCVSGRCVPKPNGVVTCDPSADTQCRVNRCDPATGACAPVALQNGTPCSDGDACTAGDACIEGACLPGGPLACGDGDPCTLDACSSSNGCSHAPVPGCTGCTDDAACRDADPCTNDVCLAGSCSHATVEGLPCDDLDACTEGDHCVAGACVPGELDVCANRPCTATADVTCEQRLAGDLRVDGLPDTLDHYGCNAFDFQGPEQVYRFAPDHDGVVSFTLFGESELYVLLLEDFGAGCETSDCIAYHTLEIQQQVRAGHVYYVVVDGYAGAVEPYELRADCSWTAPEACSDQLDNDLDGLADCDDPDCAASLDCREAFCDNGVDDEGDGLVDCLDDDCFFDEACTDGWSGETCDESFVLAEGDPIDLPADGSPVTFTRRFTTVGAFDDYTGTCAGASVGPDVAWLFATDVPAAAEITARPLDEGLPPPTLLLYAAPLCLAEYEVACFADGSAGGPSFLAAGSYFLIVDGPGPGAPFEATLSLRRPPQDEAPGTCDDAIDNDFDGSSDCADDGACAGVPWCSAVGGCVVSGSLIPGIPSPGSTLPGARDQATSVLTQYECPGETQFGYWGAERAFGYTASCTGLATFVLEPTDPGAPIDLFLLDAIPGCASTSCVAFANAVDGQASLERRVEAGQGLLAVADGYLGAGAAFSLLVFETCDEVCDNDVDDDLDGAADCEDEDCLGLPACPSASELDCANGYDEDQDGDVDCEDPDCLVLGVCPELACADGTDDDLDGAADCADVDCAGALICASPDACVPRGELTCNTPVLLSTLGADVTDAVRFWTACDAFGLDYAGPEVARTFVSPCTGRVVVRVSDTAGDPSGNLDVFALDADGPCGGGACSRAGYGAGGGFPTWLDLDVVAGEAVVLVIDGWQGYASTFEIEVDCQCRWENCTDGIDNNLDGLTDCADLSQCWGEPTCPEYDCTDGVDDDLDGVTDCDEPACAASPACPEVDCADGTDENRDGATDCADPTCFEAPACTGGLTGATCAEAIRLNDGVPLGFDAVGRILSVWGTVVGAGADHVGPQGCEFSTPDEERVYAFELTEHLVLHAGLALSPEIAGGLVLYGAAEGCDGEHALGCPVATIDGFASLEIALAPGGYFLAVEGSTLDPVAGRFRLDVRVEAPAEEARCADGVDDDLDAGVDCADPDCAAEAICASLVCSPRAEVACGERAEADLASNASTDAVDSYSCIAGAGAAWSGPESTWLFRAPCAGSMTARLDVEVPGADLFIDLFLLSSAGPCDGSACLAMGTFEPTTGAATLNWPIAEGDVFHLVADGFDGATAPVGLEITCTCN